MTGFKQRSTGRWSCRLPRSQSQVVPFLEPAIADGYHDPAVWKQIQEYVGDRLLELLA